MGLCTSGSNTCLATRGINIETENLNRSLCEEVLDHLGHKMGIKGEFKSAQTKYVEDDGCPFAPRPATESTPDICKRPR